MRVSTAASPPDVRRRRTSTLAIEHDILPAAAESLPGVPPTWGLSAEYPRAMTPRTRLFMGAALALAAIALPASASAASKPVWLCKPGQHDNPCVTSLNTALFTPSGAARGIKQVKPAHRR